MGINRAEQSIGIDALPEACFDAVVDYETFPQWQDAVVSTEVLDRYEDGLGRDVRLQVDAKLRQVIYVLRYHYDRPGRVWWDFLEGEGIDRIDGELLLEPRGAGTLATYRLGIDAGIPVPGVIARRLNRALMRRFVEELKAEAERRAGG